MNAYVGSAVGGAVLGSLIGLIVNRKHKGKKHLVQYGLTGAGVALGLTVATKVAPDALKKPLQFAQGKGSMFAAGYQGDYRYPSYSGHAHW